MTKVEKTSEFTEFVYLKNNPTGLVNDLNAEYKYRSNVLHNNRCKLRNTLSSKAYYIICDLFHLMKSFSEMGVAFSSVNFRFQR